ncbi:MAG: hypothetical protein HC769_13110 [Cyanobacteria bacterium CRU_2_1]|nr:hypothetical protein [Cyanobacteria bacterium CRU_2_1]
MTNNHNLLLLCLERGLAGERGDGEKAIEISSIVSILRLGWREIFHRRSPMLRSPLHWIVSFLFTAVMFYPVASFAQ